MVDPNSLAHSELTIENGIVRHGGGLTKREYFTGKALEWISGKFTSNENFFDALDQFKKQLAPAVAQRAVIMADALIAELNKEKP